jgi:hypothetical protein
MEPPTLKPRKKSPSRRILKEPAHEQPVGSRGRSAYTKAPHTGDRRTEAKDGGRAERRPEGDPAALKIGQRSPEDGAKHHAEHGCARQGANLTRRRAKMVLDAGQDDGDALGERRTCVNIAPDSAGGSI